MAVNKKKKKKVKKFLTEEETNRRDRPIDNPEELENQSMKQKKIAFAQSPHIEAVIQLLREASTRNPLVADTAHATVVNAVTLDAQSNLIIKFIESIDSIKQGNLHNTETNG